MAVDAGTGGGKPGLPGYLAGRLCPDAETLVKPARPFSAFGLWPHSVRIYFVRSRRHTVRIPVAVRGVYKFFFFVVRALIFGWIWWWRAVLLRGHVVRASRGFGVRRALACFLPHARTDPGDGPRAREYEARPAGGGALPAAHQVLAFLTSHFAGRVTSEALLSM